jgi:hypothetical protein
MNRTINLSAWLLALALAGWTCNALAQTHNQAGTGTENGQQPPAVRGGLPGGLPPQTGGGQHQQSEVVQGKLIETKDFSLNGMKNKQVIARIETPERQTIFVDLGDRDTLKKLGDLKEGDWVAVTGIAGQINNRQVFFADRIAKVIDVPSEAKPRQ